MYDAEYLVPDLDIPENPPEIKDQLTCFCCGICCHYRVFISLEEAQRISSDQNIPLDAFLDLYYDQNDLYNYHYWFGQESFLIQQRDGVCIFLEEKERTGVRFCRIHHVKPIVCREWAPTSHRKECQEGLAVYWHLTMSETGIIQGPEEELQKFSTFMEALKKGVS